MGQSALLFSPIKIRDLEIRNRVFVSPMCQYSAVDGVAGDWHLVHLGSRAVGGAGMIIAEATSVSAVGRISPGDTGIWNEEQTAAFKRVNDFIKAHGAVPAIQLAHAGRKASTAAPWDGGRPLAVGSGGWEVVAPSAIKFTDGYPVPWALSEQDIENVVREFTAAAENSLRAGFQVAEIHMAHGYLLHEFLSPLSNHRQDQYGGSLENRMRLPLRIAGAIRSVWPDHWPVFVRISATDWVDGGWDLEQSVVFCRELKRVGIDFVDVSSGGLVSNAKIPAGPNFQVPLASAIKKNAALPSGAVGFITSARQAEDILRAGDADAILIGREFLRDPYFPLRAARELGVDWRWPKQYERAK